MTQTEKIQGVRTRFAPSPTGFLHIGGARTALFSWAFARRHGGDFVLRIEDTDLERSTPEATEAILDSLRWLDLAFDEGPFYQTKHFDRYKAVIADLLKADKAYLCYASKEELDLMRSAQEAAGVKARYDGRWRPELGKSLPAPPVGAAPVVRFRNPKDGVVTWDDLVKGEISIANEEMDDLIIARSDGTPTYNFCVVVDDWDMKITHVIRGDDHVNNTPRQINIMHALGAQIPRYGHVPLLHGMDGQKLSKRHGAVSVTNYRDDGYLPEAVLNYLARLGWSHGDDEIFTRAQFVEWFDAQHISKGPARFDFDKLKWVNNHYLQALDNGLLAKTMAPYLADMDTEAIAKIDLPSVCGLLKERCSTLIELAQWIKCVAQAPLVAPDLQAMHLASPAAQQALQSLKDSLQSIDWNKAEIAAAIKQVLTQLNIKMPQLAVPARVALFGLAQTPSLDAMLMLLSKSEATARLRRAAT